jgi:mono/diheme cytochrome c family protein
MSRAAFDKWMKSQTKATTSPDSSVSGAAVFKENQCAVCHTLQAAGATGNVGPDLDKLQQYASTAGQPLEDFIPESITDPGAYTEKGYPKNTMPPFDLPKPQLDALVEYLAQAGKKG